MITSTNISTPSVFREVYDATELQNSETLSSYLTKSYIPISRFSIRGRQVDKVTRDSTTGHRGSVAGFKEDENADFLSTQ